MAWSGKGPCITPKTMLSIRVRIRSLHALKQEDGEVLIASHGTGTEENTTRKKIISYGGQRESTYSRVSAEKQRHYTELRIERMKLALGPF